MKGRYAVMMDTTPAVLELTEPTKLDCEARQSVSRLGRLLGLEDEVTPAEEDGAMTGWDRFPVTHTKHREGDMLYSHPEDTLQLLTPGNWYFEAACVLHASTATIVLGTWLRGELAKQQVVVKAHPLVGLGEQTVAGLDHEISVLLEIDAAKRAEVDELLHCVVDVHAVMVAGDMMYAVMEYCAGGDLFEHLADEQWDEGSEEYVQSGRLWLCKAVWG